CKSCAGSPQFLTTFKNSALRYDSYKIVILAWIPSIGIRKSISKHQVWTPPTKLLLFSRRNFRRQVGVEKFAMTGINRREMLKTIGAASIGAVAPNVLNGEVLKKPYRVTEETVNTDILIIGGGTAGVIAAIQAGRAGRSAVLVENGSQLGGTITTGGVSFPGIHFAWGKQIIGGISWELIQEAVSLNGDELPNFTIPHGRQHWRHQVQLNGPLYAILAEQKCIEAGVKLRYYETPTRVVQENGNWKVETIGKGSSTTILAKQL